MPAGSSFPTPPFPRLCAKPLNGPPTKQQSRNQEVGRTAWSAPDPLVRLFVRPSRPTRGSADPEGAPQGARPTKMPKSIIIEPEKVFASETIRFHDIQVNAYRKTWEEERAAYSPEDFLSIWQDMCAIREFESRTCPARCSGSLRESTPPVLPPRFSGTHSPGCRESGWFRWQRLFPVL